MNLTKMGLTFHKDISYPLSLRDKKERKPSGNKTARQANRHMNPLSREKTVKESCWQISSRIIIECLIYDALPI